MPDAPRKTSAQALLPVLIAAAATVVAALAVIFWLLESEMMNPVVLLILAALISLALPVLRANWFPSARDCAAEYDFHEQRLAAQIRDRITATLGPDVYQRVGTEAVNSPEAIADCRRLLSEIEGDDRAELRFALLLLLAEHCERSGDLTAAGRALADARDIHPGHFLTCFRRAAILEHQGEAEAASRCFREALDDPGGLSQAMIKLTTARLKAVTDGTSGHGQ
jgi:tetratricopeptide (TPR) repeat protein